MSSDRRPDLETQASEQSPLWQFCMNYVGGAIVIGVAAVSAHYLMTLIG
jgi:hypothetical protein